jgi:acyl-CoA hydrolase
MTQSPATPAELIARLRPDDTIAVPIATGQPRSLLRALAERSDWNGLTIFTGLLTEPLPVLLQPGVRLVSGFFGPVERMLRDSGARVDYLPRDFLGWRTFAEKFRPRVVFSALAPPDDGGRCSFGLHAGATYDEFVRAAADPDRLAFAELNGTMPRVGGIGAFGGNAIPLAALDGYCLSDEPVFELADQVAGEADRAMAALVEEHIDSGATLQIGIGGVPNMVARLLAGGAKDDFGIHTEMMVDGIRHLHQAGKVTDRKGVYDGFSVSTFAAGSRELYDWLHENDRVRFLPVQHINDPAVIRRNRSMVSINGALAIDLGGQVMADTLGGRQYSGVGGQEEFVIGARESEGGKSFFCLRSTAKTGADRRSTIVASLGDGMVTTPRHHLHYVVTEHGAADLTLATDRERAVALIGLAHPDFRGELERAARERWGRL